MKQRDVIKAMLDAEKGNRQSLGLLFSCPQGIDYMKKTGKPSLSVFKSFKGLEEFNVYIEKEVDFNSGYAFGLVGDFHWFAELKNRKLAYKIYLFHRAKIKIKASKFVVVKIIKMTPDCECEIETEKGAVIL